MSDQVLKLIPTDKDFLPSREAAEKVGSLLEAFFPDGEQVEIDFSDTIRFRDGGGNIGKITCPLCHQTTEINPFTENDPGMVWWYAFNDTLSATHDLNEATITMPCCEEAAPIPLIDFHGDAGFSKFELCIWNPYSDNPPDPRLEEIESTLGCRLKRIWAHY